MNQLIIVTFFTSYFCSCVNSPKATEPIVDIQSLDTTFLPDSFSNRADTARFNIDKGKLAGKTQTLDVIFGAVSCTCAQWLEIKNSRDLENRKYFFLEPAATSLIDADTLFNGNNLPISVSVTGQFYSKEGYPENYRPAKGNPPPARVFRYSKIRIISQG